MEGYFVIGYADGGDYPNRQIDLVPGAMEEADELLLQHEDTHARFGRVSRLIDGFESPAGMELLATVHWLVQYEGVPMPIRLLQEPMHGMTVRSDSPPANPSDL